MKIDAPKAVAEFFQDEESIGAFRAFFRPWRGLGIFGALTPTVETVGLFSGVPAGRTRGRLLEQTLHRRHGSQREVFVCIQQRERLGAPASLPARTPPTTQQSGRNVPAEMPALPGNFAV